MILCLSWYTKRIPEPCAAYISTHWQCSMVQNFLHDFSIKSPCCSRQLLFQSLFSSIKFVSFVFIRIHFFIFCPEKLYVRAMQFLRFNHTPPFNMIKKFKISKYNHYCEFNTEASKFIALMTTMTLQCGHCLSPGYFATSMNPVNSQWVPGVLCQPSHVPFTKGNQISKHWIKGYVKNKKSF